MIRASDKTDSVPAVELGRLGEETAEVEGEATAAEVEQGNAPLEITGRKAMGRTRTKRHRTAELVAEGFERHRVPPDQLTGGRN